jgi:putative addiction module CopG family antidote
MTVDVSPAVEQLIREGMAAGMYASADELLRDALGALAARQEDDLRAIQEGIEDVKAGRVRPAEEVFQEIQESLDRRTRE